MAASIARRSTYLRTLWQTANSTISISPPSIRSNLILRQTRTSLPCSPSRLRRESMFLNSLPIHSAIASACLVSKLPNDLCTSTEGRFTYYVSPI